jgi:large-conductance mechanosensitive channel
MRIDMNTLIWSLINLLLLVLMIYLVFRGVRGLIRTVKQQRKNEEAIISKLDELIDQNKEIIRDLSKKPKGKDFETEDEDQLTKG